MRIWLAPARLRRHDPQKPHSMLDAAPSVCHAPLRSFTRGPIIEIGIIG